MGFTKFRTPWPGLSAEPDPKVVDPKVRGSLPLWRLPFEAFPSSTAFDHAVTASRPFGLGRVHRLACPPAVPSRARSRVATLRCSARRPQGFLPSRSPLQSRDVSAARPLDAPLGFGSTRSRCCRAFRAAQTCWTFRLAGQPLRRPRPERRGKARCFGLVWLRAIEGAAFPEGRTAIDRGGSGTSRRRHLGRIPHRAPKETVGCQWIRPERRFHRVGPGARRRAVADVIATHLRRDSCATQRSLRRAAPVVRARALHPSAVARVRDGETARRGRSHPEVWSPACHSRASRRTLRRTHRPTSRRTSIDGRTVGNPEVTLGGSWLRPTPASWRAGLGPDSHRIHRSGRVSIPKDRCPTDPKIGEPAPKRRGCGWWPHIPREVVIRREHRSARAEMDRSPSRAFPTGVGSASVPSAPKRFQNPDRCYPGGR
jgi:hypothetical protein